MGWLNRFRRIRPNDQDPEESPDPGPTCEERRAPGIEALFDGASEDGSHALLDLGPAAEGNFRYYRRFAHQIRFADFTTHLAQGLTLNHALRALGPPRDRGFDLVLMWNILDLLPSEEQARLLSRVNDLTDESARVYAAVDPSVEARSQPLRFEILGPDRVRQHPLASSRPITSPLLPADVVRLLAPFEILHAFTLRTGVREYVGVKGGRGLTTSAWI